MTSVRPNRRRIATELQTGGRPACAIKRAGRPPIHNSRCENRPVRWVKGGEVISMSFDRMGRRVAKNNQRFVYDGYLQIADNGGNAYVWDVTENVATRPLVWRRASSVAYYAHDGNKNVSDVVASNGAVVAHYDYAPFGAVIAQSGALADVNPWRFSSEYQDLDLGLVYYNYRHYEPVTGRWLSRDPIVELGGLGLYGWCANLKYGYDVLGLKKKNRTVCDKDHEFDTRAVILEGPYFSPGPYPPDDPRLNLAAAFAALGAVVGAATSGLEDIAASIAAGVAAKARGGKVDWPDGNSAAQAIALINNFEALMKINAGFVSVWTKVKCQTCRCNKFLFFPLSTYSWQDDDSGEWVQCDIGKTRYGKTHRGSLGNEGAFAMPSRDKMNEIRDQCRKQAEGHCDGN